MSQHTSTSVITVPTSGTDLATLDDQFNFGGDDGEQLVTPTQLNARLQWFNGLPTTTQESAIGFHIEVGVNPQLDETLAGMNMKQYIVQHRSVEQNGEARQLPYWALNWEKQPCSLFVLSYGIKSKYEMNRDPVDRCGIAYGWEVVRDSEGRVVRKKDSTEPKQQCRVLFRAYVHELVCNGFSEWFQLSFNGYITEDVLTALREQLRVIETYNGYARTKGYNSAPFYGFSLPILPGVMKMVGKGKEKSPIYPPVAQIPSHINGQYLLTHRIPENLMQHIVEERLLEEATLWSMQRSQEMANSDEDEALDEPLPPVPAPRQAQTSAPTPVVSTPPVAAPPAPSRDRPLTADEAQWITYVYSMGNRHYLHNVCARFQVADATQLRKSHYDTLYRESLQYTEQAQ